MRGIFVTGTGTGIGKTIVAAGILRGLRRHGLNAAPVKPVQTGIEIRDGQWLAPDLEFSLAAAGMTPPADQRDRMVPFRYEPACSPHLAGRLAGTYPQIEAIEQGAQALGATYDYLVVEGAGGVMVPLNEDQTTLDLMRVLNLSVVIAAPAGLGTINHSLLTIEAVRRAGLPIAALVLNHNVSTDPQDDYIIRDNPPIIERFGKIPVFGPAPFIPLLQRNPAEQSAWDQWEAGVPGLIEHLCQ